MGVMAVSIRLLGRPVIDRDGSAVEPPKGRKSWALLAFLLRAQRPATRTELASLLFADADDPLAALRWSLLQLRRTLGESLVPPGDEITLALPSGIYVDVNVLRSAGWIDASQVSGLGRDLLEGMDFPSAPAFEAWLLNERRHLKSVSEAVLREASMFKLATGDAASASELALRLVSIEPLNEAYQGLLIRSYRATGDHSAAYSQQQACIKLFASELGVSPGPLVMDALESSDTPTSSKAGGESSACAFLEAGEAALRAGTIEPALRSLQAAVGCASGTGNTTLEARARFVLGSALIHSGRNLYEEGAVRMHEVVRLARELGDPVLQASAYRELAWSELLAARYDRAEVLLEQASAVAGADPREQAAISFVRGMALTEVGRYDQSLAHLRRSVISAREAGDSQREGLSLAMLGKAHLFRRELSEARDALDEALAVFRTHNWTASVPWAEAYLAELELAEGHIDLAGELYQHAFTLACEIDDPCFKAKSEVGIGLVEQLRGNPVESMSRLESAQRWLVETPDHTWTMACVIDALCSVAIANDLPSAPGWVTHLEDLAARTGMRELLVHAYLHRHALGDHSALGAAELFSRDVDNPYLRGIIAVLGRGGEHRFRLGPGSNATSNAAS